MNTEKAKGIRVNRKQAEKVRRELHKKNLLRTDLKICDDKDFIYLPIKEESKELEPYKIVKKEFEKQKIKHKSYKEVISIPDKLKEKLPTSYDVIGDIILIKLPEELLNYQKEIGKSLLKTNKNIKTVCLTQPITGELRTRNIEIIAGEKHTKTAHKEYGLTFNVDVKKTYFSPRLATERKRVANQVKQDEIIVDMFAGVAPFSIIIAKYANPKRIYAIDKNEHAVKLAKQNIKSNNVLDKIDAMHADARNIENILQKKGVKANRIIMNLPFSSHLFFAYALKIIADTCIIHYYDILKEEKIQERVDELKTIAEKNRITLTKLDIRKIKTYAPHEFYIGIDITAKKHADVA